MEFIRELLEKHSDNVEHMGNPVAKNLNKFNKPSTQKDRKKELKKGYNKHKGRMLKAED